MRRLKFHILNCTVFFLIVSCQWGAGSYPYAEKYLLKIREPDLIAAVNKFKLDNPAYYLPAQIPLIDGRTHEKYLDHWYHIYFYYADENKIIHCWTRPTVEDSARTTLAFIATNDGSIIGNWKTINKDYGNTENEQEIKKFEDRIWNKIKLALIGM